MSNTKELILELEKMLESKERVTMEDLGQFVQKDSKKYLSLIREKVEKTRDAAYCVLWSYLFEPQEEALKIMAENLINKERRIDQGVYKKAKIAHARRKIFNVAHNPGLLINEIQSLCESYIKTTKGEGPQSTSDPYSEREVIDLNLIKNESEEESEHMFFYDLRGRRGC